MLPVQPLLHLSFEPLCAFVAKKMWRRGWDSNPRWALTHSGFRDRCTNPLCDLSPVLFCSSASEKLLHQRAAFIFQNARADLNSMIQKICVADLKATDNRTCALIRRAVNQTPHTRLYQGSCAHRARFDRRINVDARQPVVAQRSRGLAQRYDFSVSRRIAVCTRAIPGNRDEFVFADNTSADGHFAACLRLASGGQRVPHPVLINLCFQRTATIGRTLKQCQGEEFCASKGDVALPEQRGKANYKEEKPLTKGNGACYYQFPGVPRPCLAGALHRSSPMSTEASQRSSGPLTTDRVTGRLRPPPPPESLSDAPSSPSALMRRMTPGEFNTAMIHFYRGEVQRSNTWRNRLDTTTNWAVITAGATLSFVFSSPNNPHFVIPINSILVAIFLLMEARRYRYYEIWSSRVRILETGYFANILKPDNRPVDEAWAEHLADDLTTPHFTITEWEAVGRRLRRNYLWIFALLALSWNLKVYLSPLPARDFDAFIERATVGIVPGWIVFLVGIIFNAAVFVFAIGTVRLREATGEVLPKHEFSLRPLKRMTNWTTATTRRTTVRAKRARQRVRSRDTTQEFKKIDISETPEKHAGVR